MHFEMDFFRLIRLVESSKSITNLRFEGASSRTSPTKSRDILKVNEDKLISKSWDKGGGPRLASNHHPTLTTKILLNKFI